MQVSLKNGKVTTLPKVNTIADGTAVKTPGSKIFPYLQKNLDDVITVEDEDLVVAFLDMVENHKMIVENSGLLTVAALKQLNVKDKRIVSILSGGNMDVITMSSVVQQGLILRDRIFTVSVLLPDKPGELCRVSVSLPALTVMSSSWSTTSLYPSTAALPWNCVSHWKHSVPSIRKRSLLPWKKKAISLRWSEQIYNCAESYRCRCIVS